MWMQFVPDLQRLTIDASAIALLKLQNFLDMAKCGLKTEERKALNALKNRCCQFQILNQNAP